MLAPYPSSAVSDLDDFLALKAENAQLEQRIDVCISGYIVASSFIYPFQALKNGHADWSDAESPSDSEADEFFSSHATESIVDKSERALAQVSAALESAGAVATSSTATAVAGRVPGSNPYGIGNSMADSGVQDGPQKKKVRKRERVLAGACLHD